MFGIIREVSFIPVQGGRGQYQESYHDPLNCSEKSHDPQKQIIDFPDPQHWSEIFHDPQKQMLKFS